jgi:hypothetical protein
MYARFESGVHPREHLGDLLLASKDHCTSLEDHVTHLTKVKRGANRKALFILNFLFSAHITFQKSDLEVGKKTTHPFP